MGARETEVAGAEAEHRDPTASAKVDPREVDSAFAGGTPEEVAAVLKAHPHQRDQLLRVLHDRRGNAFVAQVMAVDAPAADDSISLERAKANGPVGHRFGGDGKLGEVEQGGAELKVGDISPSVRKVQQALRELGYMPISVTGTFDKHTEAQVKAFQVAEKIARTDGVVDSETFTHIEQSFYSLKKYADIAQNEAPGIKDNPKEGDADNPETALMRDTQKLGEGQKAEANEALTVHEGPAGSKRKPKFKEHVKAGDYGKRVEKSLQFAVDELYAQAASEKEAHDKGQTFEMSQMVDIGNAAKGCVDSVFGSYAVGPKLEAGVNLKDRFETDTAEQEKMDPDSRYWAAYSRAEYFMNAYDHFEKIDREHHADRNRAREKEIIEEVLDRIARKNEKKILVISASFPASMNRKGIMKIQRIKSGDEAKDRDTLWTKFGSMMHEYLHSLTHSRWHEFRDQKDLTDPQAGHALAEGAAEFLTRVALSKVNLQDEALRATVEGSLPKDEGFKPDAHRDGKYDPAYQRISRLVGTVGIYNFYAAYFLGQTQLIGA